MPSAGFEAAIPGIERPKTARPPGLVREIGEQDRMKRLVFILKMQCVVCEVGNEVRAVLEMDLNFDMVAVLMGFPVPSSP